MRFSAACLALATGVGCGVRASSDDEPAWGRRGVRWTLLGARDVSCQRTLSKAERGRLVCDGIYPGVRLTVVRKGHAVAYRFDLAPGAQVDDIRMRYDGADDVRSEEGGRALSVRAAGGRLRESGLRCFQEEAGCRHDVACRYAVSADNEVAIALGTYDRRRPLVIDPEIEWSSYLGGSNIDFGDAIAVDSSGNAYVAGYTYSSDFPAPGGFDTALGGGGFEDAFVSKVDAAGSTLLWSSYLGGAGSTSDYGYGIAVDSAGNAYVTGVTYSSDFPTMGGFDTTFEGGKDAFVAKVDASGSMLTWSSYLGGSNGEEAYGIVVDSAGDAYVTGYTYSSDFPTVGGFDTTLNGREAFVSKVAAAGSGLLWSSFLGGSGDDYAWGIAVDSAGNTYVTGYTLSSDFPTPGGFDTMLDGTRDGFVSKVAAAGSSLLWSSYLGGSGEDNGRGIDVDSAGNVYVAGETLSADFPTMGGFDTTFEGLREAFVGKVAAAGSPLLWSSYLGGSGDEEYARGIAADSDGNAYVAGYTNSADFPTMGGFDTTFGGSMEPFVSHVAAAGSTLLWSSYLGGSDYDEARGIAVDSENSAYVTGYTDSSDFPTTGGFDTVRNASEAFVTKIGACGNGPCGAGEDACNCPADCGADSCGNGCCGAGEDCASCGGPGEDCECMAPLVCQTGACVGCGDGNCESTPAENCDNCMADCMCAATEFCDVISAPPSCASLCGDGLCVAPETECTCSVDCLGVDDCGDACCSMGETTCDCPGDCGPEVCGDGACCPAAGEDCTCADCACTPPAVCASGMCTVPDMGALEGGLDPPPDAAAEPTADMPRDAAADGVAEAGAEPGSEPAPEPAPEPGQEPPPEPGPEPAVEPVVDAAPEAPLDPQPDGRTADGAIDAAEAPEGRNFLACDCSVGKRRAAPPGGATLLLLALLTLRRAERPRRRSSRPTAP